MELEAVLSTLDGVDDAIKPLYREDDGQYILNVKDVDVFPQVRGLKTASESNAKKAQERLDKVARLEAQIADLTKNAPDTAATQAKIAALQDEIAAREGKISELSQKYQGVTRDRAIIEALTVGGVKNPTFQKAAMALIAGQVKVTDDGSIIAETDSGPTVLDRFIKGWLAKDGAAFVEPASGGGAQGGTGKAAGAKTVTRDEFDRMGQGERSAFSKSGGKVVD